MLSQENIRRIQEAIAAHPAPMLSLYVDINPANPDNSGKAYLIRAKEAARALEVPGKVLEQALGAMERLPEGRLPAVFAGEDWLEAYDLQTELPLPGGVEARWGEPYLTPLMYALDEYERYAVVLVDQEKWRLFEVHMGKIEELEGAFRAVATNEWRELGEDATSAGGRRARGPRRRRQRQRQLQRAHGRVDRALLQGDGPAPRRDHEGPGHRAAHPHGPRPRDQELRRPPARHLPRALRPALHAPLPRERGGGAQGRGAATAPLERERENRLLDTIRERGIWGLQEVLEALQEGRLYLLAVPWNLGVKVFRCASGGVGLSREAAEAFCPGEGLEEVPLKDALPALAQAYNVRLEIVHGEVEARLHEEFGGLAGLVRW